MTFSCLNLALCMSINVALACEGRRWARAYLSASEPKWRKPTRRPQSGMPPTDTRNQEQNIIVSVALFVCILSTSHKTSNMSTATNETNRPPVDHDIEIRIRRFRNSTVMALRNSIVLIVLVLMLWFYTNVIPSTVPIPVPLRWACIVCLYLSSIGSHTWLFHVFIAVTRMCMSEIENDKRPQNHDLETRLTNHEDWILANFCVMASLSTIGFVVWYWIKILTFTVRSIFYWTCTTLGLCLLLWLLKRALRFYRKAKKVEYKEAGGILVGVNITQIYKRFQWIEAGGVPGQLLALGRIPFELLEFLLDSVGFQLGRGPLFGEFVAKVV
jgi:hypothetical protein